MKIKIEFEVELPDVEYTNEEIEEFLRYKYGDNGDMSGRNPLADETIEPIFGTFEWEHI